MTFVDKWKEPKNKRINDNDDIVNIIKLIKIDYEFRYKRRIYLTIIYNIIIFLINKI